MCNENTKDTCQKSWWARTFGRSILRALIGDFFADKNNAASIIAIMLVASLCYLVVWKEKFEYINGLLNIVFVVIGYYFGSKREVDSDDKDDAK
jgi:glucose uptake protein GlcU